MKKTNRKIIVGMLTLTLVFSMLGVMSLADTTSGGASDGRDVSATSDISSDASSDVSSTVGITPRAGSSTPLTSLSPQEVVDYLNAITSGGYTTSSTLVTTIMTNYGSGSYSTYGAAVSSIRTLAGVSSTTANVNGLTATNALLEADNSIQTISNLNYTLTKTGTEYVGVTTVTSTGGNVSGNIGTVNVNSTSTVTVTPGTGQTIGTVNVQGTGQVSLGTGTVTTLTLPNGNSNIALNGTTVNSLSVSNAQILNLSGSSGTVNGISNNGTINYLASGGTFNVTDGSGTIDLTGSTGGSINYSGTGVGAQTVTTTSAANAAAITIDTNVPSTFAFTFSGALGSGVVVTNNGSSQINIGQNGTTNAYPNGLEIKNGGTIHLNDKTGSGTPTPPVITLTGGTFTVNGDTNLSNGSLGQGADINVSAGTIVNGSDTTDVLFNGADNTSVVTVGTNSILKGNFARATLTTNSVSISPEGGKTNNLEYDPANTSSLSPITVNLINDGGTPPSTSNLSTIVISNNYSQVNPTDPASRKDSYKIVDNNSNNTAYSVAVELKGNTELEYDGSSGQKKVGKISASGQHITLTNVNDVLLQGNGSVTSTGTVQGVAVDGTFTIDTGSSGNTFDNLNGRSYYTGAGTVTVRGANSVEFADHTYSSADRFGFDNTGSRAKAIGFDGAPIVIFTQWGISTSSSNSLINGTTLGSVFQAINLQNYTGTMDAFPATVYQLRAGGTTNAAYSTLFRNVTVAAAYLPNGVGDVSPADSANYSRLFLDTGRMMTTTNATAAPYSGGTTSNEISEKVSRVSVRTGGTLEIQPGTGQFNKGKLNEFVIDINKELIPSAVPPAATTHGNGAQVRINIAAPGTEMIGTISTYRLKLNAPEVPSATSSVNFDGSKVVHITGDINFFDSREKNLKFLSEGESGDVYLRGVCDTKIGATSSPFTNVFDQTVVRSRGWIQALYIDVTGAGFDTIYANQFQNFNFVNAQTERVVLYNLTGTTAGTSHLTIRLSPQEDGTTQNETTHRGTKFVELSTTSGIEKLVVNNSLDLETVTLNGNHVKELYLTGIGAESSSYPANSTSGLPSLTSPSMQKNLWALQSDTGFGGGFGDQRLNWVPKVIGWQTVQAGKKFSVQANKIESIGATFGAPVGTNGATNNDKFPATGKGESLTNRLGLDGSTTSGIEILDVTDNGLVFFNIGNSDDSVIQGSLKTILYKNGWSDGNGRANYNTLKYLNLSGCNGVVPSTFTKGDTIDGTVIDGDGSNGTPLSALEVVWFDDLDPVLTTTATGTADLPPGVQTAPFIQTVRSTLSTSTSMIDLSGNNIAEFSMKNVGKNNVGALTIDLSLNEIATVANGTHFTGAFGPGQTRNDAFGSYAAVIAENSTNIRLDGAVFDPNSELILDTQKQSGNLNELKYVKIDGFNGRNVNMGQNPELNTVFLTNSLHLEALSLVSLTGNGDPISSSGIAKPSYDVENNGLPYNEITSRAGGEISFGTNQKIQYLSFSGSFEIPAPIPSGGAVPAPNTDDSAFNVVQNALIEVDYSRCTQLVGTSVQLYANKIEKLDLSNIDGALVNLDLYQNEIVFISNMATGFSVTGLSPTQVLFKGSPNTTIDKQLVVSYNPLRGAQIVGMPNLEHLDFSYSEAGNDKYGHDYVDHGIAATNNAKLYTVNITEDTVKNLYLNNCPELGNLIGTFNVTNASTVAPDKAIVEGVLNLDQSPNLSSTTALQFQGHAISDAIVSNTNYVTMNFRRQNGTGETAVEGSAPAPTSNFPAPNRVTVESDRGFLQSLDLTNTGTTNPIQEINLDENRLQTMSNTGPSQVNFTGSSFATNARITANFNDLTNVAISANGIGNLLPIKEVELDDNKLINLDFTNMTNLTWLCVNRTIDINYNSFVNGSVVLTGADNLEAFAPATAVLGDKVIDDTVTRKKPVEPNEHRWLNQTDTKMNPTPSPADTYTNAQMTRYGGTINSNTDWGYYTYVPVTNFNAVGCTNMKTIRIPGNRLTSSAGVNDSSLSTLEFLDISGAQYTEDGTTSTAYKPNPARSRYGEDGTAGISTDALSNQIGGTFVSQLPALKVLYAYNNQITLLDMTRSTNAVEILAHRNNIGSKALNVQGLAALRILDVERNQIADMGDVPYQSMEILRAGQNQLQYYPSNTLKMANLRQLYVNHNNLGYYDNYEVPRIDYNPKLEVLNFANNNYIEFPYGLSTHANLKELYAYNNQLTKFPGLNPAGQLIVVDLAMNLIVQEPEFPPSLQYLDLSDNKYAWKLEFPNAFSPAMANSTAYDTIAHEVIPSYDAEFGTTDGFVGTLDIRNNQITHLPTEVDEAWFAERAGVMPRPVYRVHLEYNLLDIDRYSLNADGSKVPSREGTQKWLVLDPNAEEFILLNYVDYDRLKLMILPHLMVYHPGRQTYERPSPIFEYDFWWDYDTSEYIYNNEIIKSHYGVLSVAIREAHYRNTTALVPIDMYDHQNYPNNNKKDKSSGSTSSGSTLSGSNNGEVIVNYYDDPNYNPQTGY